MFDGRWRAAVDRTTEPVGRNLVRAGINADMLTVFGLLMSAVTAFVVGTGHFVLGIVMLFPTGLPDLFDGPVAKASGTASMRGAFFDSVADRLSDAFLYGGVAWYLAANHHGTIAVLPFAILAMTSLISYERAKAELLGLPSKGGLMERAERFILLGVCFVAAAVSHAALVPALWVFFGLVTATACGRFARTWREAEGPVRPVRAERRPSIGYSELARRRVARWRDLRADSRWRAWREDQGSGMRAVLHRRAAEPFSRWWTNRSVPSNRAVPSARSVPSNDQSSSDRRGASGRSAQTWRERRAARRYMRDRWHERTSRHTRSDGT
jgi:CDP-diacylglycerol---glycerol-3-phosphate 3-phosphatidyltransferase